MEKELENLSLNDEKNSITEDDLVLMELQNSIYFNKDFFKNNEKLKLYFLPFKKFCSFFKNEENCKIDTEIFKKFYDEEKKTITLPNLANCHFETFILIILGIFNKKNLEEAKLENLNQNFDESNQPHLITEEKSYLAYILRNISILVEHLKPIEIIELQTILEIMGIFLEKNIFQIMRNKILNNHKILIVFAGGNNFWFKSEKSHINGQNYACKLNNYSFLFMNWKSIEKFFSRFNDHPRCEIGIISSMNKKNLEKAIETLKMGDYKSVGKINVHYVFDQDSNKIIFCENSPGGKNFERCCEKIKEKTKNNFSDVNMVFLESEFDKSENIKHNVIKLSCFSEEFLNYDGEKQKKIEENFEKLLDYLENMLNELDVDVKEYLAKNPFSI